jgi:hypothetical protein
MAGMFMFDVAYGLGCDSEDLPTLVRLQNLLDAAIYASMPATFLVVNLLLIHKSPISKQFFFLLECLSCIEISSLLATWRVLQALGTTMG